MSNAPNKAREKGYPAWLMPVGTFAMATAAIATHRFIGGRFPFLTELVITVGVGLAVVAAVRIVAYVTDRPDDS